MGAVLGPWSLPASRSLYRSGALRKALDDHNSHSIWDEELHDALTPGATGTNVNDMVLVLLERK